MLYSAKTHTVPAACRFLPCQVHTIERSSRMLRVVGFGLLALFLDPRDGGQPLSRNTADYVINAGAFQASGVVVWGKFSTKLREC